MVGGKVWEEKEDARPHDAAHFAVRVVVGAGEDDAFVEADHAGDASSDGFPSVRLAMGVERGEEREKGGDGGLTSLRCRR